jgi:hypothetical protein
MRLLRQFLPPALTLILVAATLVACAAPAAAFNLRSPQVSFNNVVLNAYFLGKGQAITTLGDQLDAQTWASTLSGNSTFTIMLERSVVDNMNSIGIYNTNDPNLVPALFQVFPGAATPGWHALAHFSAGNLMVSLFDNMGAFQGQTTYYGVDPDYFGFYLQRQSVLFFSQDGRNPGGKPQMLTYAGTGNNWGTWWECFEDFPYNSGTSGFAGAVLSLESVIPVPADVTTWGRLKSLYR